MCCLSGFGRAEHLQRLLHFACGILQADQSECEIQQRQEQGLHTSGPSLRGRTARARPHHADRFW